MITSPNPVPDTVHVLAIPGSLRAASYNRLILDAATTLDVPGTTMDVFGEVADIPVFNEDLQNQAPDGVHSLWSAVSAADALLFATPEYNQSLPGSTKNLIDWLSRAPEGGDVTDKPVAVIGATTGPWGTRTAQTQLRHALLGRGAFVLPAPTLFIRHVDTLFTANVLTDHATLEALQGVITALAVWTRRVRPGPA